MIGPGSLINGKYRLGPLLGEGGMGSIFEARHEFLGTEVALKFLHPALSSRANVVARFVQEARVSANIKSPHIVGVVDVDQTGEGLAFLVMELLRGEPLSGRLAREPLLPTPLAVGITVQVLLALEAAHVHGVVHRDMKPENVFLTSAPGDANAASDGMLVKILDFGIAKLRSLGEVRAQLTRPGVVMGTPEYMAPEQVFAPDQVDGRADLYAVGAMLFEMLAGRRPLQGDDPRVLATAAISGDLPRLDRLVPRVPAPIADVVAIALAGKPEARFSAAGAMRKALLNAAKDCDVTLDVPVSALARPRTPTGMQSSSLATPMPARASQPEIEVASKPPIAPVAVASAPSPLTATASDTAAAMIADPPKILEAARGGETIAAAPSPFAPAVARGAAGAAGAPSAGYPVSSGGTDAGFRPPFNVEGAWVPPAMPEIPRTPGRDEASSSRRARDGNGALWVAVGVVISLTIGAIAWILWPSSPSTATDARAAKSDAGAAIVLDEDVRDAGRVAKIGAGIDAGLDDAIVDAAPIDAGPPDAGRFVRAPMTSARPLPSPTPSLPPTTFPSTFPSTFPRPDAGKGPDIIEIPLPWPVPVRGGP